MAGRTLLGVHVRSLGRTSCDSDSVLGTSLRPVAGPQDPTELSHIVIPLCGEIETEVWRNEIACPKIT